MPGPGSRCSRTGRRLHTAFMKRIYHGPWTLAGLACAGQTVAYRAYSCREGAYLPPVQLPAQPLVILEGSYSHHPLLRPYETLRVFVTCAKPEQTRRLQAREGARYAYFAARWVPLEEGYFAQYGVAESADFVVDTTQGGTI